MCYKPAAARCLWASLGDEDRLKLTISHTYRHMIRVPAYWLNYGVCGGLTR